MPRTHVLERKQTIPATVEALFPFFENPHNLASITPPWLQFRVRRTSHEKVRQGSTISHSIRWFGLPMRWDSVISHYEEKRYFVDEMVRGPYRTWAHTHEFHPVADGVEMSDRVVYSLPMGIVGDITHSLMVRRQLDSIFDYRSRRIAEIFACNERRRAHDARRSLHPPRR